MAVISGFTAKIRTPNTQMIQVNQAFRGPQNRHCRHLNPMVYGKPTHFDRSSASLSNSHAQRPAASDPAGFQGKHGFVWQKPTPLSVTFGVPPSGGPCHLWSSTNLWGDRLTQHAPHLDFQRATGLSLQRQSRHKTGGLSSIASSRRRKTLTRSLFHISAVCQTLRKIFSVSALRIPLWAICVHPVSSAVKRSSPSVFIRAIRGQ